MGRGKLLSLGIFSALIAEAPGWAQQRPNGFFLTSPLSMSAGYDNGFAANSRVLDDTVTILTTPTVTWFKSTHRASLSADYQAEFEMFAKYQNLNCWNHTAIVEYSYRINSRLSFDAGDSFLSTTDASRQLSQSQLLLPQGRYQQNSLFAGLKYRLGHRTVAYFRFDNAATSFAFPRSQAKLFDQLTSAGTATLDHTVNRHHSLASSYSYMNSRPLDGGSSGFSYQAVHSLSSSYMYTVNSGLNFRLTGGVVRGREFGYTAGAAVEKHVKGVWLMAGYQRYLSFFGGFAPTDATAGGSNPFANGLLPNSVFEALSMRVRGRLTKRMGLEFSGQRGLTLLEGQSVRSLIAKSRLDYRLNERLVVFARAEYYGQNLSPFSGSPLSRGRYFGGVEIDLSRTPEPEGGMSRRGRTPAESTKPATADPRESEGK